MSNLGLSVHGVSSCLGFFFLIFLELLLNFLFGDWSADASDVEEDSDGEESEVNNDVEK